MQDLKMDKEGLGLVVEAEFQRLGRTDTTPDFQTSYWVTCNCFTVSDGEMQEVGVGLYPSVSLLNHSCDPNCVIVFEGKQLLLHAVRHIQAEEEDTEMLAGEEESWKELKASVPKVEELQSAKDWEQMVAVCQATLDKDRALPDNNLYVLKMLDLGMDGCIHLARWEDALQYGARTLRPFQLYYSGPHPVRGVQLMKVGKLQYHQGMLSQALDTLKQAFDILKVTHGKEHSLSQSLQQLLGECEVELSSAQG
uniref:SET and MYND domain containing 3 n=1 Tax=Callorhinchus milii TaxID=7868 RepID=A0A4W3KGS8_CALMI